jgi:PAS domain S-box-containing protein
MIGRLHERILKSIEETLPFEFSVLDADDKVIAWNKHETRIFKRPVGALGKNVRDCHPRDSLVKVEQILAEMKKKRRDKASFWIDLSKDDKKLKILIEYYALRDGDGKYLGCLELTQDITEIQKLSGEKRLLNEV